MHKFLINTANAASLREIDPNGKTIEVLAVNTLNAVLFILGAVTLLAVIYSGALYIMSAGNPDKITKAHRSLFWSIGGLLLIVLAYTIVVVLSKDIGEIINTP